MFRKGTAWQRGYASRDIDAWYASGGRTSSVRLAFDEELLVLRHRGQTGAAIVSGADSYDVLRWDGTCVSLQSEEISWKRPPSAKQARVPWKLLDMSTREALMSDARVRKSLERRTRACAEGSEDDCGRAESALSRAVVESVRTGGTGLMRRK